MTAPAAMTCSFGSLQAKLAALFFGQWGVTVPLSVGSPFPTAKQILQINDCIADGLSTVYSANPDWSFLRPVQSITTVAPYTAGKITLASGVVTLVSGTWPSWLALTSTLTIGGVAYTITNLSPLTLANPPANITTATACTLTPTPYYALPAGFDSIEGPFTFPTGTGWQYSEVDVIREVEIRKHLSKNNTPGPPRYAAIVTSAFDPTVGSQRQVLFYPIPDAAYVLSATMTLRTTMIDATNQYPLGAEVLAPVIVKSVLAAAERNLESAPGVHCQQLEALLAAAVASDRDKQGPDNLGQGCDAEHPAANRQFYRDIGTMTVNGQVI